MHTLTEAIRQMNLAKLACEEACRVVWISLLDTHPDIQAILKELDMDADAAAPWFCAPYFDNGTKTAAELFDEGRGNEVLMRIRQIAHGVYR